MKLFNRFSKSKNNFLDEQIVSACSGEVVLTSCIDDKMFAEELLGKTFAVNPDKMEFVAPCNGTLEVLFPTKHAFAVRSPKGTGILVHIGINTVDLDGKGFKTFAKQGDKVVAGQKIIEADLDFIESKGFTLTTMLIVTEPEENKQYEFNKIGTINKGEIIL